MISVSGFIASIVAFIVAGLAILGIGQHSTVPAQPWQVTQSTTEKNVINDEYEVHGHVLVDGMGFDGSVVSAVPVGDTSPIQKAGSNPVGSFVLRLPVGSYALSTDLPQDRFVCPNITIDVPRVSSTTISCHTIKNLQSGQSGSAISVPGMSKYTDADFGFSFWYPSGWTLVDTPVLSHNFEGGKVIKHLEFTDASTPYARRISIDEFYTSSSSITDYWRVGFIKHYFDDSRQQWMIHDHSDGDSIHPVDIKIHTMGGLPIFESYQRNIVPLTINNFIIVSGTAPNLLLQALAKTIISTDSSLATPISVSEQIKVIQAEKDAYAGQ